MFRELIENYDVERGIPRPAYDPHLPSYEAACLLIKVTFVMVVMIIAGVLAVLFVKVGSDNFGFQGRTYLTVLAIGFVLIPRDGRRGGAPLAEALQVRPPLHTRHGAVGDGARTREAWIRAAGGGSAIFLDPKGELYGHSADHYREVYRLDLVEPRSSDRWNFIEDCRGNPEAAREFASLIVGKNRNRKSDGDSHWLDNAAALLTAVLLHLPTKIEHPTPQMAFEFLALNDPRTLATELANSSDPQVRIHAGPFIHASPDNQRHVVTGR